VRRHHHHRRTPPASHPVIRSGHPLAPGLAFQSWRPHVLASAITHNSAFLHQLLYQRATQLGLDRGLQAQIQGAGLQRTRPIRHKSGAALIAKIDEEANEKPMATNESLLTTDDLREARPLIGMSVRRHSRAGWDVLDFAVQSRP
jgi:hypothetical protein